MAIVQCDHYSPTLRSQSMISVVLPTPNRAEADSGQWDFLGPGEKYQVLYLLHGFGDDHTGWLRHTCVERYAAERRLALVLPSARNSAYADTGRAGPYWTYVFEELPRVARSLFPLSAAREDNFVAGLSMGGYGAFKAALRLPGRYAAAASLSGVLDMARATADTSLRDRFESPFDSPAAVAGGDDDLFALLDRAAGYKAALPSLYQACGTEDFLYADNLRFRSRARDLGIDIRYEEGPGEHTWDFWDASIRRVLDWLPLKRRAV